jgi:hypothetical protein
MSLCRETGNLLFSEDRDYNDRVGSGNADLLIKLTLCQVKVRENGFP